jgi:hypothetical protein
MGIRMNTALHNKAKIKATDYNPIMKNHLFCDGCGVAVLHVKEHERTIGETVSIIPAHFRLLPKTIHKSCKYMTSEQLNIIEAANTCSGMITHKDNIYITRLQILTEVSFATPDVKDNIVNNYTLPKKKQYVSTGQGLPYLNSINQILKLHSLMESDVALRDLRRNLILVFPNKDTGNNEKIPWSKFFYDFTTDDYLKLYKYIFTKNPSHPCCVHGKIKNIKEPNERFNKYDVLLHVIARENNNPITVHLHISSEKIYKHFIGTTGKEIYVYGNFICDDRISKNTTFHNIITNIYNPKQILILN